MYFFKKTVRVLAEAIYWAKYLSLHIIHNYC